MLELTPPSAPGHRHGRVSVFVMEPGGTVWLSRVGRRRLEQLLVPRSELPAFRTLLASARGDRAVPVKRHSSTGTIQRLLIPAGDLERVREAIRELWRFESDPSLPEWKERGYRTPEEIDAYLDAHPEEFELPDDDAGPEPG